MGTDSIIKLFQTLLDAATSIGGLAVVLLAKTIATLVQNAIPKT